MDRTIVYMDQNNIFFRYKKLNFSNLLKYLKTQYDVIRATSYNAISISDENQKKFTCYLSNNGWISETVDINENTNVDGMIITNMMNDIHAFSHNVVTLISGDGDYAYTLRLLSKFGYKCHVVGAKDHISLELLKVSDFITYLEDIPDVII